MSDIVNNNKMHGVVNGLYYCNNERTDEINDRIYIRNIPSNALQPRYSQIPVSTKYSTMPILDQRMKPNVPLMKYPIYNTEKVFNPGNATAPWTGFANNVNIESNLRNQFFAKQRCEQAYYVPSSKSDLYNTYVHSGKDIQNHPLLFEREVFEPFNPNTYNLGNTYFSNNNTREQSFNIKINDILC